MVSPVIAEFSVDSGTQGDHLTNDATITLIGTADPNVKMRILANGILLGTATSDENGGWVFTTPELSDGSHSFTAETGNGHNLQSSDPFEITIDSSTPAPEITSFEWNDSGLQLVGTAEAGASVEIYRDRILIGTVTVTASGSWEYLDTGYGGGSVSYRARATDAAGNTAETADDIPYPPPPNEAPLLDLDGSAEGTGYDVTFIAGGAPVAIADEDVLIGDDGTHVSGATITLTNAQEGDALIVDSADLPAGIAIDPASTATTVILIGSATLSDYEAALRQVLFNNTSESPGTETRTIEVTVDDGEATSNVAITSITVDNTPATTLAATTLSASSTPMIFEARVASGSDDVEEQAKGAMAFTSSDLELAIDGTKIQTVGIRFTDIDIPQGAIITNAYIQFTVDRASSGDASLLIQGEDTDDAAAFTTVKFNVSSRTKTDASVAWEVDAWTTKGDAGLAQRTPDLAAIVQEIIDRGGWAALNDMVFVITGTGTRAAESFDGSAAKAPLLHIEYYVPQTSDPVVFNTPADSNSALNQIAELAAAGTEVGITASARDPDAGDTVTYSIDDERFITDPSTGVITRSGAGILDFETETSITLTVTATSSDRSTATQSYTLNILDSPEPVTFNDPADADPEVNWIAEKAAAGTQVGITASATDPDAGSTVTYSIDDPRFAIDPNSGVVTRSGVGTLSAHDESSIDLTVTATSSDGSTATESFSIAVVNSANPTIFETRVASGSDDAEEASTGKMSLTSSDLELSTDGTTVQTVGIRFTGIDIPQGAIITNAYIQFTVDEVSSGAASLLIQGEDTDDAAGFTTVKFDVSSRARTDASVSWEVDAWTKTGVAGLAQRTPDLATIIQEIVDREGWAALNDMAFVITGTGTRTAEAFEGGAAKAPLLHIEYYVPQTSAPVVFNTPADSNSALNQIAELAAAGTQVGITASARDPDAGDTVTYSIDDERFIIDPSTGVITRSGTGILDFETETSITLTVTATSSDRSTATQSYVVNILDSPEPVAFNTPADIDAAPNRIAANAGAGTKVGITASATDPDAGSTVTYSLNDTRFAIDGNGIITRSGTGTLNAQNEPSITLTVKATSSDGSIAFNDYAVEVTSGTSNQLPSSLTFVRTILTSQWSPASPDPSGIAYISHLGRLLISDGEVEEMSIFAGKNTFEMSLSGQLVRSFTTTGFSNEPTGVAYNPTNKHLYFTDDDARRVYELNPGTDGIYGTSDDLITSFKTSGFGNTDPEGITYDTKRGVLYIADGKGNAIYTINPGPNGRFEGGGDDIVTKFSVTSLGVSDPEGVEYDPVFDLIYIIASRTKVVMATPTGELLGTLDISAANALKPAGLALAPSSGDPNRMSLYIADRGVDNGHDPNENDGKVYEFLIDDHWLIA